MTDPTTALAMLRDDMQTTLGATAEDHPCDAFTRGPMAPFPACCHACGWTESGHVKWGFVRRLTAIVTKRQTT